MEEKELQLNSQLARKKNAVRKELAKKGILKRGGNNDFDHYKYFSEAQYKELMNGLFSDNKLELTTSIINVEDIEGTAKQTFGRRVLMQVSLTDIETGYSETSVSYGEGMDKGDKALYKAYTGALKYYLADTFMVATGDDAEKESQESLSAEEIQMNERVKDMKKYYSVDELKKIVQIYNVKKIQDIPTNELRQLIEDGKKKALDITSTKETF